ncbi:MFS transporter [Ancylobacter dichloromethanicus]|uniref:ABC transporter permease n=1 Tax=Ancylobacter dichloromethanicus TaxID=518825 RepID=A0A9W6J6Q0_9HYPH|nr:MFS transporter [Ancylobacter dichloromethanicus]MBS7554646.1 MFS transporter [Ancylobacter dichloromethanicus]GLK71777.1 ABC transporter permease [Ancylobacter dichloromethanicus]
MHAPALPRPVNIASIAAAIAAISVVGLGLALSIPLLAFELHDRGISSTWIGINTAVGGLATIALAPFLPDLVRRLGAGPLLLAAILSAALSLLAFKFTASFVLWFPLRFIFGAALCVLFVVSEFWINAAAPNHRRGLVIGIYGTVLSVGFAGGPAILSLVGTQGWAPYLCGAVFFALAGIPVLIGAASAPAIEKESTSGSVWTLMRIAPAATLAAFIFGAVETGLINFLPLYGLRRGLDEGEAALLLTVAELGNVALQLPLGLLSDKLDRRRMLLACGIIGVVGSFLIPHLAIDSWALWIAAFFTTGIVAGLYTVGLALLGARFDGAALATANAAFVMLYSIGLTVGPTAVGGGMQILDPHGFAWTIGAFLLLYVLVVAGQIWRDR